MKIIDKSLMSDLLTAFLFSLFATVFVSFIVFGIFSLIKAPVYENENFGGVAPMKIYQVYDKDTGVYYAVTEQGGICVMQTANGEVKLVDQGDGQNVHPNKG